MLYQDDADGSPHPVAFRGRKLQNAELNYPIHEKEGLAIKEALRSWSSYIQNGHKTVILTDHESLKYLQTMKTPSKRVARWFEEFHEYDVEIRYRKGSEAVTPDAISRRPDFMSKKPANLAELVPKLAAMRLKPDEKQQFINAMGMYLMLDRLPKDDQLKQMVKEQKEDFALKKIDGRD